eukprot:1194894-Prorocentrum_minimum.AAC.5
MGGIVRYVARAVCSGDSGLRAILSRIYVGEKHTRGVREEQALHQPGYAQTVRQPNSGLCCASMVVLATNVLGRPRRFSRPTSDVVLPFRPFRVIWSPMPLLRALAAIR